MTIEFKNVLPKKPTRLEIKSIFLKMARAIFRSFSKVDFCVIVQNKKARVGSSGNLEIEKTNFSMKNIVPFIVGFLDFVSNNKISTRNLHV